MFGYVTINKDELKLKDYDRYHSYYCGLCHSLYKAYGRSGQITLSFDMTFLYVLLSGLYEPEEKRSAHSCVTHPLKKHERRENEFAEYAADMNVLLSYYNLLDDWQDDRHIRSLALSSALKKKSKALKGKYPRQYSAVTKYVSALSKAQAEGITDIDEVAGLTGTMLGEIFVMKEDEWQAVMRRIGFFLGKFIYLMDALLDREEDEKLGHYNIWNCQLTPVDEAACVNILNMMMSECAIAFEKLPILMNADILRNVIYSGVWLRYEAAKQAKSNEEK